MMSSKKQLLAQYDLHCKWFHNALADFTDEEVNQRLDKNMNHVKYLAGHLLNSQYAYAMIGDIKVERKWDELFAGRGKSRAKDNFPYPTIEEIKAEWDQLQPTVRSGLEALPEETLKKELPGSPVAQLGVLDSTIGDLWAFLNLHQVYHIGQIGILRKGFGKEAMKYS